MVGWQQIAKAGLVSGIFAYYLGQYLNHSVPVTQNKAPAIVGSPFVTVQYPHFRILYSNYHKSPLAVHQHLNKKLFEGDAPRAKFFFPDETIPTKFQTDNSYFAQTEAFKRFRTNRGHMAAAGNYSGDQSQKFHTFVFSNIIPQNGYNNGGIWNTFQRLTRSIVMRQECQSVEVISGPIYADNRQENHTQLIVLKQNGIPIPEKLYKIIKCNSRKGAYMSAFEFYNSRTYDNQKTLSDFQVPLSSLQKQTGLTFNVQGKPLSQLQGISLKVKKQQLDYEFFMGLMKKSVSLGEMVGNIMRAKQQNIRLSMPQFTQKIRKFTQEQISKVQNQKLVCSQLKKYMSLRKKLYSLYHLQETNDLTAQKTFVSYLFCYKYASENAQQNAVLQQYRERCEKQLCELAQRKLQKQSSQQNKQQMISLKWTQVKV